MVLSWSALSREVPAGFDGMPTDEIGHGKQRRRRKSLLRSKSARGSAELPWSVPVQPQELRDFNNKQKMTTPRSVRLWEAPSPCKQWRNSGTER